MITVFESYNFYQEIEDIDFSTFDISRVEPKDMFDYIYSYAPVTIKDYIDTLKNVAQRPDYHPEGNAYIHTKVVVKRIAKTGDINLILAAFLHDLGKDRTEKIEKDTIMHPHHELYSAEVLNIGSPWRDWIRALGGDPYIVRDIVLNHMRLKDKNNKKSQEWISNLNNKLKTYLEIFNDVDTGGLE